MQAAENEGTPWKEARLWQNIKPWAIARHGHSPGSFTNSPGSPKFLLFFFSIFFNNNNNNDQLTCYYDHTLKPLEII